MRGQEEEGINAAGGLPEPAVEEPPSLLWEFPVSVPLSGPPGDGTTLPQGSCRPEEEEGKGYLRSPSFSGLSGTGRLLSPARLCWLGPGNCRWEFIRVPVPPTYPLSKKAIANGSLCSPFQSLGVRVLLHTVIGSKAYLSTSTVQGPATKFNQRSDRVADFKSLVILK